MLDVRCWIYNAKPFRIKYICFSIIHRVCIFLYLPFPENKILIWPGSPNYEHMLYANYDLKDTIVALATPPGVGAIGVIRLSGEQAISIVNALFEGKDLQQQKSHTIHFGNIRDKIQVDFLKDPDAGEDRKDIAYSYSIVSISKTEI